MYGIRYTGSGYMGSTLAMDKELSKMAFRYSGIPTPEELLLHVGDPVPEEIGLPCVVKPCSGGSSVGTSVVRKREELDAALAAAFACEDKIMVEQYIRGRELTAGVLDGEAMPIIEIIPKSGFYDYKNKYQAGLTLDIWRSRSARCCTWRPTGAWTS
jgi:D-alanine-D-alanine ligase